MENILQPQRVNALHLPIVLFFFLFSNTNITYSQCNNTVFNCSGNNDRVVVGNFPVLDDFTVMGWFRSDLDNFESFEPRILNIFDSGPGRTYSRLEFGLEKISSKRGSFWIYDSRAGGTQSWGADLRDNTWHHFAYTKSGGTRHLYLDGELLATWSGNDSVHGSVIYIGSWYSGQGADWNGSLDDIRIYNTPFSVDEVLEVGYCGNLVATDPTLVAAWTFEDGIPNGDNTNLTTTADASINGHDGTFYDTALNGDISNIVCPVVNLDSNNSACCEDVDGDGFFATWCGGNDCDDNDPNLYPGSAVNANNEWIESIELNDYANFSGSDGGYGDYSGSSNINLTIGESHELILDPGYAGDATKIYWRIYIDFNQDGEFSHGAEREFQAAATYTLYSGLNIPANVSPGITKMRVIASKGGYKLPCSSDFEGEIEDYTIQLNVCDPIIDGGLIGPGQAICPNNNNPSIISSVLDASGGTGPVSYQWLTNTSICDLPEPGNANNWTEIAGATDPYYDPGTLNVSTLFLRAAKNQGCNNYTYSNIIEVVNTIDCTPDCMSSADASPDEWIKRVKFGNMANNSGDDAGYADYSSLTASVTQNKRVTYQLRPGFENGSKMVYWRVWADWNQDGFYSDLCELIVEGTSTHTINGSYYIPADAEVGNTTLRASMKVGAYPGPCETGFDGEVEDYSILVIQDLNPLFAFDTNSNDINTSLPSYDIEIEQTVKDLDMNVQFYPNPATEILTIELSAVATGDKIFIHDALGKLHYANSQLGSNELSINLKEGNYSTGMYFISYESNGKKITKKVLFNL